MRLFIAVDLSNETLNELERLQNELIDANLDCSRSKSFHLTLKFLGEVNKKSVATIVKELEKIKFKEFGLTLGNLGVFEHEGMIKVLWAGIEKSDALDDLYNAIKCVLHEFKNDKDFSPHLTLARIKSVDNKQVFMDKLEKTKANKITSQVNSFVLYKSTLTHSGAVYEKIKEFY